MALTGITNNFELNALYNPMYFVFDSDNKDIKTNFRYVCKVSGWTGGDTAGTLTDIATLKQYPDPTNNDYGVFDLSEVLLSELNEDVPFSLDGGSNPILFTSGATGYPFKFDVYEEYVTAEDFTTIGSASNTGYSYDLSYIQFTVAPNYSIGQQIFVTQDDSSIFPGLEGIQTVVKTDLILGSYFVLLDIEWAPIGSTYNSGGTSSDAYNRRSIIESSKLTGDTYYNFNGRYSHQDFRNLDKTTQDGYDYWLSNIPSPYKCKSTNEMYLNYFNSDTGATQSILMTVTSGGTDVALLAYILDDAFAKYSYLMMGPSQIANYNWSDGVTTGITINIEDITEYSFGVFSYLALQTPLITIEVDSSCSPKYDNVEIIFEDKLGSYILINFELISKESIIDIDRSTFLKNYGSFNSSTNLMGYDSWDKGDTVYNVNSDKVYTANSNWITEDVSNYLEEMFTSKNVYVKMDGEWLPIVIEDTNYDKKKRVNVQLINIQITYRLAVQ